MVAVDSARHCTSASRPRSRRPSPPSSCAGSYPRSIRALRSTPLRRARDSMEQLQTTGGVSGPAKHSQRARKRYAPTWGVPGLGETPPCGAPAAGHAFLLPDIFVMTLKQLCLATAILPTVSCSKPVTVMAVLAQNVSAPVLPELRSRLEAAVPALFRTTTTLDQHGVTWDGGNSDQGWLYLDNHYNPAPQDRAEFRVRA